MSPALPLPPDVLALRLAVHLAARLVRPIGHFAPDACAVPPLTAENLAAMAAHPAFREPINRVAARGLAPAAAAVDAACIARIRTHAPTRLAVLLVSQPARMVREAALLVGAAILHRRIVGLVLKTERERIRAALGERAFLVATQEAPLLHAPLAEIAIPAAQAAALGPGDAETGRGRIADLGMSGLARFVAAAEPPLGPLFARLCPTEPARRAIEAPLGAGPCDHIVRLLRRRMDLWSPIIA